MPPVHPAPAAPLRRMRPFVGRQAETERFEAALRDPVTGGAVLRGAAGAGVSRLADHLLERAASTGHPVHRVRVGPLTRDTVPEVPSCGAAGSSAQPRSTDPEFRRTVLLVDELHLLEPRAAAALVRGLDAHGVFLLATVDFRARTRASVTMLEARDDLVRIELAPLDAPQTAAFLRDLLGSDVDGHTLRLLDHGARGNIRILCELVDGLRESGRLHRDAGLWRATGPLHLTARLEALLRDQVDQAPPEARACLELLALTGPLALADLHDLAPAWIADRLQECDLITVRTDGRRRTAALTHPVLGDALGARIPLLRRRELLAAHAERVRAHGGRREDDLARITGWEAAAGRAEPGMILRAAHAARSRRDQTTVLTLLESVPADHATAEVELLRGEALLERGTWQAAEVSLRKAAEATATAAGEDAVSAATSRMTNLFWSGSSMTEVFRAARQARSVIGSEQELRALREVCAGLSVVAGHPAAALAVIDRLSAYPTTQRARMTGDGMRVLGLVSLARAEEALERADRHLAALAVDSGASPFHHATMSVLRVVALTELGRPVQAEEEGCRQAGVEAAASPVRDTWLAFHRGRCARLAGRAADARNHFADAIARSESAGHTRVLRLAYSGLAAACAELGEEKSASWAAAAARAHPGMGFLAGEDRLGEAWLHAVQGRLSAARSVLEDACEQARRAGQQASRLLVLTDLVRLGGHAAHGRELAASAARAQGPLARARGAYARAMADEDGPALLRAATDLAGLGVHLLAAESAAVAAQYLRRTGRGAEAGRAERLASAERARVQGNLSPHLMAERSGQPLTPRERDVALRAARRMTTKEIAAELGLSPRTVDNVLLRVYRKVGVGTRRELSGALAP
ncbi:LuxR C-terminal-related transcriptional regulator [Streptomyces lavendulae]|uniref:helix-turn-helix transcriptional regulator n=1 Tax=Streptomyces lavendulae TaxID=1914 RepID=UPI0036A9590F